MSASRRRRAVFLDRDGVVNELSYVRDHGRVETPMTPAQFRLMPGVGDGIKALHDAGFRVVIVSNQPGIAKGQFSTRTFTRIRQRAARLLQQDGVRLDGEYYCLHHPSAIKRAYRRRCDCRKPQPGLLLQAAEELGLDVRASFMVGDGLVDVEAGRRAGCRTVLVGHVSSLLRQLMREKRLYPTRLVEHFNEAVEWIVKTRATS